MPTNIEIKARANDFNALRQRAERLSNSPPQIFPQTDTFFSISRGRLKLRELGPEAAQLIYYQRPDQGGPKRSDYQIFETDDAARLKGVLAQALGIRGTVRKVRTLYLIGQTRVHLDEVEGLGRFLELEVVLDPGQTEEQGREVAEQLIGALGLDKGDLLEQAYIDLLEQQRQRERS